MHLDLDGSGPLYMQVYRAMRGAINAGVLAAGTKLVSSRALAKSLHVSRNVVLLAYGQLLAEGYVQGRGGSGSYVLGDPEPPAPSRSVRARRAPVSRQLTPYARVLQDEPRGKLLQSLRGKLPRYDFRYSSIEMSPIARREWGKIAARRERHNTARTLSYADPQGDPALRAALSTYLRFARGLDCQPEQIVITHGTQEALDLTMRALVKAQANVVLEHPHRCSHAGTSVSHHAAEVD